jgi:hypothetical protein
MRETETCDARTLKQPRLHYHSHAVPFEIGIVWVRTCIYSSPTTIHHQRVLSAGALTATYLHP